MKKSLIVKAAFAVMLISGVVHADPVQASPMSDGMKNAEIERVLKGGGNGWMYEIIDHNPMRYSKKQVGNNTVESWVKDGTAYTSVNGDLKKQYQIKGDLKIRMKPNGEMYEFVNSSVQYRPQKNIHPTIGAK